MQQLLREQHDPTKTGADGAKPSLVAPFQQPQQKMSQDNPYFTSIEVEMWKTLRCGACKSAVRERLVPALSRVNLEQGSHPPLGVVVDENEETYRRKVREEQEQEQEAAKTTRMSESGAEQETVEEGDDDDDNSIMSEEDELRAAIALDRKIEANRLADDDVPAVVACPDYGMSRNAFFFFCKKLASQYYPLCIDEMKRGCPAVEREVERRARLSMDLTQEMSMHDAHNVCVEMEMCRPIRGGGGRR